MAIPTTDHTSAQGRATNTYNVFRADMSGQGRTAGGASSHSSRAAEAAHFDQLVKQAGRAEESRTAGHTSATAATSAPDNQSDDSDGGGFIAFIKAVIDIINPLQHIPVISTIYRHITGDEISPMARIAGGTLYGGPIGAAVSVVNVAVENSTGRDIGENVLAMASGTPSIRKPDMQTTPPTMFAAADIVWSTPAPDRQHKNTPIMDSPLTHMASLDPQKFPPSVTPTSLRTQTGGNEPGSEALPYAPVHSTKKGTPAPTEATPVASGAGPTTAPDNVGDRKTATHPVGATPVLPSQDALAAKARKALPPEQIAADKIATAEQTPEKNLGLVSPVADNRLVPHRMMEALDKYAALKKSQHNTLVPTFH